MSTFEQIRYVRENYRTSSSLISKTVTTISSPSHGSTLKLENSYKLPNTRVRKENIMDTKMNQKCNFLGVHTRLCMNEHNPMSNHWMPTIHLVCFPPGPGSKMLKAVMLMVILEINKNSNLHPTTPVKTHLMFIAGFDCQILLHQYFFIGLHKFLSRKQHLWCRKKTTPSVPKRVSFRFPRNNFD
jgi:hypothetical protein